MVLNTRVYTAIILAGSLVAVSACGKKDDNKGSGATTGAPQAYPPTALVTPSVLLSSAGTGSANLFAHISHVDLTPVADTYALRATPPTEPGNANSKSALMAIVKDRLFSPGPTNILELVKKVDGRMAEYDRRVSEMENVPSCLSSSPVDVSSTFSVPAAAVGETAAFPLFGQCQETVDPGLTLMFGKKDNDWYLVDGATKNGDGADACVMTMAKISGSSDADRVVDGYMAVVVGGKTNNFTGSTTLMHFKANVAAGTLEFTAAGAHVGFEQIHAKSSRDYVYVRAQSGQDSNAGTLYHACFSAGDLSNVSLTNCSSLSSSLELVSLGTKAVGTYVGPGNTTNNVLVSDANNVDLTTIVPNFCGKLTTSFSAIPKFGG
jgi:hypothetical protein